MASFSSVYGSPRQAQEPSSPSPRYTVSSPVRPPSSSHPVASSLTPSLSPPTIGAFVSLVPTYFAEITPRDKFGARLGAVYVVAAAATLCGSPTGGALLSTVDAAHFHRLIVFCGVVMFAGVIALAAAGLVGQSGFRRMLSPRGREEEAEKVDPGFER